MVTLHVAFAAMALSGVGQTVLLDFYSDSCGPCREMQPTVQALINAGYQVQRVNVANNRPLAAKYGIYKIPCFVMLVDGREVDRVVGMTSMSRLRDMYQDGVAAARASQPPATLASGAPPAQPLETMPLPGPPSSPPQSASPAPAPPFDPWSPAAAAAPAASPLKAPTAPVSDAALLAASVRLRVEDPDGRSCGSGTIIDNRDGEALVLTCGHIFKDSQGKGPITVDLFGSGEPARVPGRLISYDPDRDVALVAIRTPGPVAVARLAPPDFKVSVGMPVASVGCNDGDRPTVQHSQVNSLNKFQGPPNLTVAGQPVEGRSGGGLFSSEGYVVGVCNARDPEQQEGLFAPAASAYAELDRDQLSFVYKSPSGALDAAAAGVSLATRDAIGPARAAEERAASGAAPPAVVPATAIEPIDKLPLPAHEQAALDEIRLRQKQGAKVIIVICPPGGSDRKGDVIVVDHASQGFVGEVAAEGRRQGRCETSLEVHNPQKKELADPSEKLSGPRKVILEWSLPPGTPVPNPASAAP